ncbi:MAG: beta-galactosidase, partial [Bryobacteraceae bacterium]
MFKTNPTIFVLFTLAPLTAAELILPSPALDRTGLTQIIYRLPQPATGHGKLNILWTDTLGRVVEQRTDSIQLQDESEARFSLDLRRALAMKNQLQVHLTLDNRKDEDAQATFIARPPEQAWQDYAIIMWQPYPSNQLPALQKVGINGGQHNGRNGSLPEALIENNLRWYSENIGTDFYAEYHRYRPDRTQNWSFLQAKELYAKDPTSKEAFKRHPSLWDPVWRAKIHDRLVAVARKNAPYRPWFYSLADESGIADLAAFWDFDFSDESLVPMRRWLAAQYPSLAALNKEWGSAFASWDLVTPPTTHEAMQRKDDNFSAWADFKEWMDISFADALKMGTDAIHEVDKDAYVSIGGGQMPGWGGYDYSRLTQSLTAIEPYDIGNNVEIIRSLNPRMPMLTTGFANGPWEKHRVWRELLHGNRGLILWDEKHEYTGARGEEAAKYYNEIREGIGALIINSTRVTDPIAIHYSQASMRTEWMLARRSEGDAWTKRLAKIERTDNDFMRLRESWCRLIEDQGLQYNFVSSAQLEQGELLQRGYRVLVLPRSSALSAAEAEAIRDFAAHGGRVIADGAPGTFNERSRRLEKSQLANITPINARTLDYHQDRLTHKEGPVHKAMGDLLHLKPQFAVTDSAGHPVVGVEVHVFRNGGTHLIALQSNPQLRVDELGPPDFRSNERFETPVTVTLTLPSLQYIYDVRKGQPMGQQKTVAVTIDPYEPTIFAVSPEPQPDLHVTVPVNVTRGASVSIAIEGEHIVHLDVENPQGKTIPHYSGNFAAFKLLPLACNDPSGAWKLKVRDILTGQTKIIPLQVN